ncbi:MULTISPECIES: hypothetical protein [Rhizobium]|uniref:Uncharacterized protein n=1 Tax=Rhizobium miluonense TaxID=411945 RepID=A0A1C3WRQ0_9HYPH|nr:hypothetical protein [Rhizobium miluonense]SCB42585.1 hypothetical protein GA0061102_103761 [Rhizobium miluonense]
MSDCDNLHPGFRDIAKAEYGCRQHRRLSLVEALAAIVVLLLVLVTNFHRSTNDTNAEATPMVAALGNTSAEFAPDHCRECFPALQLQGR